VQIKRKSPILYGNEQKTLRTRVSECQEFPAVELLFTFYI